VLTRAAARARQSYERALLDARRAQSANVARVAQLDAQLAKLTGLPPPSALAGSSRAAASAAPSLLRKSTSDAGAAAQTAQTGSPAAAGADPFETG
jgi:hypothetical protein